MHSFLQGSNRSRSSRSNFLVLVPRYYYGSNDIGYTIWMTAAWKRCSSLPTDHLQPGIIRLLKCWFKKLRKWLVPYIFHKSYLLY